MNTIIEKKIRAQNCFNLNRRKKQKRNEVVLLKNKDKTDEYIKNNLYYYLIKNKDAPCSSEAHLKEAVYKMIEKLNPDDELFNEEYGNNSFLTQVITRRYILGLFIPDYLKKYINSDYAK